jgi:hypothetical protein
VARFVLEQRDPSVGAEFPGVLTAEEQGAIEAALAFFFPTGVSGAGVYQLARYTLEWAYVVLLHVAAHGYVHTRRARSIKKRLKKRLVRQTQTRFWVG